MFFDQEVIKGMKEEVLKDESIKDRVRVRLLIIKSIYPRIFKTEGERKEIETIKNLLASVSYRTPLDRELSVAYKEITTVLGQSFDKKYESTRTVPQRKVVEKIRSVTKLKVYESVWVGRRSLDIFLPSVAGELGGSNRLQGLVIEVDGGIHNNPVKQKKDQSKYNFLHELRIGLVTIENSDTNHPVVLQQIENLKKIPKLDSRAKGRVWRRVYLQTIAYNATNQMWWSLFGIDLNEVEKKLQEKIKGRENKSCLQPANLEKFESHNSSLTTKEWLTTAEAASYLGVSKGGILNRVASKIIRVHKLGGRNRYRTDDLRRLLIPQGDLHGN